MRVVADTLIFCAKQGIVLRGHREYKNNLQRGNFLELFELIRANDPEIKKHLNELQGNAKMI